jgi:hypothetical protein
MDTLVSLLAETLPENFSLRIQEHIGWIATKIKGLINNSPIRVVGVNLSNFNLALNFSSNLFTTSSIFVQGVQPSAKKNRKWQFVFCQDDLRVTPIISAQQHG